MKSKKSKKIKTVKKNDVFGNNVVKKLLAQNYFFVFNNGAVQTAQLSPNKLSATRPARVTIRS